MLLRYDYADALSSLDRNALRKPDYRVPRPTAFWSFDNPDHSGTRILDLSGDHHVDVNDFDDYYDGARFFDTADGILTGGELVPLGDATVSFWIRPGYMEDGSWTYPFRNFDALNVRVNKHSSDGTWRIRAGHTGASSVTSAYLSDTYSWTHVAVVRDNLTYRLYRDGVEVHANTASASPSPNATSELFRTTAAYVRLDDVALWEYALASEQVEELYQRGQSSSSNRHPPLDPFGPLWDPASAEYQGDNPNDEQRLGLPVKIIETASKHAQVVETYAERKLQEVYGSCYAGNRSATQQAAIERAGQSMRYLNVVEALARQLTMRSKEYACSDDFECQHLGGDSCGSSGVCLEADGSVLSPNPEPDWHGRYREAFTELRAARGRAIEAMRELDRCENPLGVPEDDLPLYFGDVSGTNSRFFASSDYLVEDWAKPAVTAAEASLRDARDTWLAKRDGEIHETMAEQEADRRLETLTRSYARSIRKACGITEHSELDVIDRIASGDLDLSECFYDPACEGNACPRGELGVSLAAVRSAEKSVELARAQQTKLVEELLQQADTCAEKQARIGELRDAADDYGLTAWNLRMQLNPAPAGFGDAAEGCFRSVAESLNPFACLPGASRRTERENRRYARQKLNEAKDELDAALREARFESELASCWDDAERRQRDLKYQGDYIIQRQAEKTEAERRFAHVAAETIRTYNAARSALAREEERTVPSIAHHHWLDERITRFEQDFERARRVTYLAMRAAEYELQQSLGLRSAILTAAHPNQLMDALHRLDAERGTRAINSSRPSGDTEVLSLRADVLQLRDQDKGGSGERSTAAIERLQVALTNPQYAVRDSEGRYLGQGIPFSMGQSGALKHRCAERLWRVGATIQGDLTTVDSPNTQVFLLKRNVFKSEWCSGLGDETDYQVMSTAGGSNLFLSDETPGEASEHTTALLSPWYNVRRSDFYRDAYTEGSSEELAGRGLYGDYVLLFPYHGMLEPEPECDEEVSPGCSDWFRDLRRIEDVLIRFDYYSVDNLDYQTKEPDDES